LVRHLVLPGGLAGTEQVLEFLSRELSPTISVNVMGQYQPYFKAAQYPPLDRPLTVAEFQAAAAAARKSGPIVVDGLQQCRHSKCAHSADAILALNQESAEPFAASRRVLPTIRQPIDGGRYASRYRPCV
jgi:hypothetical protein